MSEGNLNSDRNLYYRLLELLPVQVLKSFISDDKTKYEIIDDILNSQSFTSIENLFSTNIESCKQHIYLFDSVHTSTINFNNAPELFDNVFSTHIIKSGHDFRFIYFLKTSQNFISYTNQTITSIDFLWPIVIEQINNILIIKFVILERATNLINDINFEFRHKMVKEQDIVKQIASSINLLFGRRLNITPLDLNKGLKRIWELNIIDSPSIKAKSEKSTSIENMDLGYYVKKDCPDIYNSMITKPILKTSFHFIKFHNIFIKRFTINPTFGEVNFNTYSRNGAIKNVIKFLLKYN